MSGEGSTAADIYLGLGSNLGDKAAHIREATRRLESLGRVVALSSLYRTEPVGYADQDWFLNAALHLRTRLSPRAVLEAILAMEREMGRIRTIKNGPRIIDIDLLLWGEAAIDEPGLSVPHPRIQDRLFVLVPLAEIAPELRHPALGRKIADLRDAVSGQGGVERFGSLASEEPGGAAGLVQP